MPVLFKTDIANKKLTKLPINFIKFHLPYHRTYLMNKISIKYYTNIKYLFLNYYLSPFFYFFLYVIGIYFFISIIKKHIFNFFKLLDMFK